MLEEARAVSGADFRGGDGAIFHSIEEGGDSGVRFEEVVNGGWPQVWAEVLPVLDEQGGAERGWIAAERLDCGFADGGIGFVEAGLEQVVEV